MNVLAIAPHPDDEVLGLGGTLHRLAARGHNIVVAIVTKGWSPLFPPEQVDQVRQEALAANPHLGVQTVKFLDLPVTRLNELPRHELNAHFDRLVTDVEPEWVFLPFAGDRHSDHREVFNAAMVALRPAADRAYVRRIFSYETPSETHWNAAGQEPEFVPQAFVDITDHLTAKLEALQLYASQIRPDPDARSLGAVEALARWRGSIINRSAAEAFMVIREHLAE